MSFTEICVDDETTDLIPKNNDPHYHEHEDHGPSFVEKWTRFTSGVGKTYLTVILVCVIAAVSIILLVTLLPDSDQTFGDTQTLKQSIVQPAEETTERDIIVDIPLGQVQGKRYISRDGREYYGFLKLPYAQPPVGRLRFKHPQPPEKWEGVLNESQGPPCIQVDGTTAEVKGEENCLFLNVFTPKLPSNTMNNTDSELLSVMVYIYGGAFFGGDSNVYSPKYLMDEDVLFVNFNHRLGSFGFLNTEDGQLPGNLGFKDQIILLKWVQENIESFGGDPNKICVFGSSSGAISVSLLMLSPMSEGLFHRAIALSGTAIIPSLLIKNPLKIVYNIGQQFNCSTKSTRRLLRCLRDVDAKALVSAVILDGVDSSPFGPTLEYIDDPNDLSEIFLPSAPYERFQKGEVHKIPFIMGNDKSESLEMALDTLADPDLVAQINENWTEISPSLFRWNSSAINPDLMSKKIRDFYFQKDIGNDTWRNLTDLISDHSYVHPVTTQACWHARHNPENVFLYYFTKEVKNSHADGSKEAFPTRDDYGPAHGDDLQFLLHYNTLRFPEIEKDSPNYKFSKKFIRLFTNFATTGQMSTPEEKWIPINPKTHQVSWLQIDDKYKMTDVLLQRMKFWDQFSPEELLYV